MYSPSMHRLRDSAVKTRSPLGTPPFQPQSDMGNNGSTPLMPPPTTSNVHFTPSDQLDNIFQAIRKQIDQWGENAKWKIDLVLLDNPTGSGENAPARQPMIPHPASPLAARQGAGGGAAMPVSPGYSMPYPAIPSQMAAERAYSEEMQQQLRDATQRQQQLENIVKSQTLQIQQSQSVPPEVNKIIETMRSVYMMSENEQKLRYLVETKMLHKDMEALSRKLKRMSTTLQNIETMKLPAEDYQLDKPALLEERRLLRRKLHLAELRLSARDAELEYLYEILDTYNAHSSSYYPHNTDTSASTAPRSPTVQKQILSPSPRRGPPYLFQQQYSPKLRHDIRPPTQKQQSQYISGLESLGIVADRMLNDPEFNATKQEKPKREAESTPRSSSAATSTPTVTPSAQPADSSPLADLDARRSKRSIDSANTLLAMPSLMFPKRADNQQDIVMAEDSEGTQPSKRPRMEANQESNNRVRQVMEALAQDNREKPTQSQSAPPTGTGRLDARQSPSIAALLDGPLPPSVHSVASCIPPSSAPKHHISPHATPPMTHAHEVNSDGNVDPSSSIPGYRPPSPASTPKDRRAAARNIST